MRLHWMKDRVERDICDVCWEPAETNLADCPTKHHSPTHHRAVRPIYTYQGDQSPATVQGCVNVLKGLTATRHPASKPANSSSAMQTGRMPERESTNAKVASLLPSLQSISTGRRNTASLLPSLRDISTAAPNASLPASLQDISAWKTDAARTQVPYAARLKSLKCITQLTPHFRQQRDDMTHNANNSQEPLPPQQATTASQQIP